MISRYLQLFTRHHRSPLPRLPRRFRSRAQEPGLRVILSYHKATELSYSSYKAWPAIAIACSHV